MSKEIWKPITIDNEIFKSRYAVSNRGRVASYGTRQSFRYMKLKKKSRGYYRIHLHTDGGLSKSFFVHVLVTHEFIGKKPDNMQVNHKNGIKIDNDIINLEYITPKSNTIHAYENNLNKNKYLNDNKAMKIFELNKKGLLQKEIANKTGYSGQAISYILSGKSRPHLKKQWENIQNNSR